MTPLRLSFLTSLSFQEALRIFKEATDYTNAMTDLAVACPHLDTDALTEFLARSMFMAEAWD